MSDDARIALRQHFGFDQFRPGQEAVIEHLLAGRSAAAVFPTGAGKSLCYQLPALLLPGVTLVVSPLIALMKDQIDALAARDIAAARLDSTLGFDQYREVMEQLRGGQLRLLYVAPERFNNERFRQAIRPLRISLFAVDEAHCISAWGHNFRPDYLKLAGFARQCGAERLLALTATATERVLEDICRGLEITPECAVRTGFYRSNLALHTTPVSAAERDGVLLAALGANPPGPTIVYVTLPKSLEGWSQEIGRAGRDGAPAICHMLVCPDDLNALENFVYGDTPDRAAVQGLIRALFSGDERLELNLYSLSAEHDIRPLVLRTLLTYLELEGWMEGGTPFYAEYRFKPLMTSREILGRFEGDRRAFLAGLFRQARKARTWFDIDPAQAATALGTERERVVRALDWLGEQRMLEVQATGVRHRYRRLRLPEDLQVLADELHQNAVRRESAEIDRLQQVLKLAGRDACQTAALAAHFAERLETRCGHCQWCRSGKTEIPPRHTPGIPENLWPQVAQAVAENGEVLAHPRSLTRFLCGIPSPRLSRARIGKHPLAGTLEQVPFREVLEWVERNR